MADKVKLYGMWGSPFSNRVEIALKMKGVEYEYVDEDIQNKSSDLLRYNPVLKKVPVLVHGNKAIAESQVILEYIDETWDSTTRILPRDPYQRASVRFWAQFIDQKLLRSIVETFWFGKEEAKEETLENMKVLDKELEGKRFLGGESVGFVDIMANFIGYWLGVVEEATEMVMVTKEAFPSVHKWQDEFVKCEVVKETLPQRDKLVTLFRARIQATRVRVSKLSMQVN